MMKNILYLTNYSSCKFYSVSSTLFIETAAVLIIRPYNINYHNVHNSHINSNEKTKIKPPPPPTILRNSTTTTMFSSVIIFSFIFHFISLPHPSISCTIIICILFFRLLFACGEKFSSVRVCLSVCVCVCLCVIYKMQNILFSFICFKNFSLLVLFLAIFFVLSLPFTLQYTGNQWRVN